ncbi:MAG: hypothetical protein J5728_08145 [Lachnospiraceae bacterium]|nr:hypothetical protein [Lachnospiraceae bacterium]
MERYRNFVRLEQMKENIRAGRNEEALKLADCLNPAVVRSNSDLSIMSDLYLESGMLAKAGACLDELYSRKKTRSILMQLINLSVRLKKVEEAETYYREFKAMAPDDFYNYIFRYSIDKIKGRNYDTLIEHLEKLKATEYIDSWAYELAKLYHKAGRKDDCIRECDDIVIWFGDGEYVDRAKALKAYYLGELSGVMRPERNEAEDTEEEPEAAAESEAAQETGDSGIVEIIGSVEEAAAAALPEEENDDDMVVVPEKEAEPEVSEEEFDAEDESEEIEEEFAAEDELEDKAEDIDEPDVPDETEVAEETSGTAAEPAEEEESDFEEDLRDFEADIDDIKIADEVFAQIEGYEGGYIEVEPVDVSGVINDEDFEEENKAPAGSVSVKYESEEEETEEEMQLEDDDEETGDADEDVTADEAVPEPEEEEVSEEEEPEEEEVSGAEEPEEEPEEEPAAAAAAEAEPEEEIETVSHSFKGPGSSKIAPDSLLAAFLAKKDAQLEDYFGFFAYQRDIRGQLIKVLEILLNPQIKNKCLIVSGEHNSGSKTIIKGITKILYQNGFLKSPQVAFTEAEKMNTMSLEDKMERLLGCCVLINNAGRLSADAVGRLLKANEKFAGRTAVIITDHRSEINRMLKDYREINSMFPQRVHIPSYDMEDMEDLLFVRLEENSCEIEKHAYQLMMKKLKAIVKEVHEGSLAEADRFIGGAIDCMETRNAKKLLAGGFGQVKSNDRIVTAEDVEG